MTTTVRPEPLGDAKPATSPMINMGFTPEPLPANTHMCYIFNDEAERRDVIARYTNSGMAGDEFVGYFADLDNAALVDDYLNALGIHPPDKFHRDGVMFCPAHTVYCPDGHFTARGMINRLKDLYCTCQDHHWANLRVTGEMTWALSPHITGADQLVEYESRLNLLMDTHPLTAICQYDANRFDGATLFEILQVHPMMVVRGQIVRNPYYIPAREFLTSHGLPLDG
ncbi:MAG: MEDS domain-containing protein [Spirulina sp.]